MQSAVAELQQFLATPPPSSSSSPHASHSHNAIATAHAQLQALRDSGDVHHLFLRSLIELGASNSELKSQQEEELLFHCVTGCRHVILLRWKSLGILLRKAIREYFLCQGLLPSKVSRTIQAAYWNSCASFWKRSWVEDLSSHPLNNSGDDKSSSSQENTLVEHLHQALRIMASSSSTAAFIAPLINMESPGHLLQHLQHILTTTNDHSSSPAVVANASRFLSVLVGEFAGKSASQYHLPLEFHKQAHEVFERGIIMTSTTNEQQQQQQQQVIGLNQCLFMSMNALGQWVPRLLDTTTNTATPPTLDEDVGLALVQLTIDVIGWEWGAEEAWDTTGGTSSGTTRTLVRPPVQWKDIVLQPDFVKAIFQVHHVQWQQQQQSQAGAATNPSYNNNMNQQRLNLLHALRQLIILLASLTGSIFTSNEERQHFCNILLEGTLNLLQTPNITTEENFPLLNASLSIVARLFINFKMSILAHLPMLATVLERIATIGRQLLQDNWQECQEAAGDLELMIHRDWREEGLRLILEGLVILCGDSWLLYSGSEDFRTSARAALGRSLGPLYVDFVTCRMKMSRLEEMFYMANETELDEVREEISAVDLEEEMASLANVGRLSLGDALGCLSARFQQLIPQIQSLWEGSVGVVTPEAAGLLEESRLVAMYVGHLLTDDNEGETPVIPDTVLAACQQNESITPAVVAAVQTLQQFAQFQATNIAQHPGDPRLSPLLAREFLWFFLRWAPAYILPIDYGASGGAGNTVAQAWANPEKVQESASFVVTLCIHYHCYWPQERQVQEKASLLLQAMAKRCKDLRLALVAAPSFRELLSFHCLTSGIRHSAPPAEFESTVLSKVGNSTVNLGMARGYQRLPYDIKSKILSGLLISCSEHGDENSKNLLNDCLRALHEAFSSLVQALSTKQMDPSNVDAKEMTALCVELYGGVARSGEMVASERISKYLTPSLAHLAGLMAFYADDLSICESLLRLFRDYAEQFIAVLDNDSCLVLFKSSGDLLKSYSVIHCASTRIVGHSEEEEQSYNDILCAIQLLIQLGTKDFIGVGDTGGLHSSQVTDMIFFGLQQILPLMTRGLLQFPTLCTQYFSLVGFMMETYPEKVKDLPYELLDALLESLLYGMSHHDTSVAKASLQGISGIVKEHIQNRVLDGHLSKNADLLDKCSRRLLVEVVFQTCVWDRVETSGMALFHLAAADLNRFAAVVQSICQTIPAEQQSRLSQSFQQLLQPELMSKVLSTGYEGRKNRVRFKKDFEAFCHEIHSFLVLK